MAREYPGKHVEFKRAIAEDDLVFGIGGARYHVAELAPLEVSDPDRKGRRKLGIYRHLRAYDNSILIDGESVVAAEALVTKINTAIAAARSGE